MSVAIRCVQQIIKRLEAALCRLVEVYPRALGVRIEPDALLATLPEPLHTKFGREHIACVGKELVFAVVGNLSVGQLDGVHVLNSTLKCPARQG